MKILLKTIVCVVLFTFTSFKSEAKGRDVVIFLKDSTEVKGELLSVRDSLVAIAVEPISADEDIAAFPERVKIFKINIIENIYLKDNNALMPTAIGALTGLVVGSAIGFFNQEKGIPTTPVLGAILGIGNGAVAGMMWYGHMATEVYSFDIANNRVFLKSNNSTTVADGLSILKSNSRFSETEPAYLRDTIDNLLKETK